MLDIRPATAADLQGIQQANIANLPENYVFKFILYHGISWPQGSFVAVNEHGQIIGYVLAKMEDEEEAKDEKASDDKDGKAGSSSKDAGADAGAAGAKPLGAHITSIAVNREYRRHGIARRLLEQSLKSLKENYLAERVSLHVRKSNHAALRLYRDGLHFEVKEVASSYYADGEDAYAMEKRL